MSPPEKEVKECIFCKIIAGETPERTIYEDDICVAFNDIKPDAQVHIQVVPRKHIVSITGLGPDDVALARHLRTVGEKLLDEAGHKGERIYGYHVPPYTSIKHLHMHSLGLPYLGLRHRVGFVSWAWWYKSSHDMIKNLEKGLTGAGKKYVRTQSDVLPTTTTVTHATTTTSDQPSTSQQ